MSALHQHVPTNTVGRDFIVGDLHGCLDLLQVELGRISFDAAKDRLFSVGDLTDRGPDSMGCLRLLREPWFHAVRGNHEDMLLDYAYPDVQPYGYSDSGALFFRNGGRWVLDLAQSEQTELRDELLSRIAALPYVITVGEAKARFHVAHAELMTGCVDESITWYNRLTGEDKTPPKRVLTDDELTDDVLSTMTEALTWGRRLIREIGSGETTEVTTPYGRLEVSHKPTHEGLALTYVGHTPLQHMVLHASHLYIDRGAYARKPTTCLLVVEHAPIQTWLST